MQRSRTKFQTTLLLPPVKLIDSHEEYVLRGIIPKIYTESILWGNALMQYDTLTNLHKFGTIRMKLKKQAEIYLRV